MAVKGSVQFKRATRKKLTTGEFPTAPTPLSTPGHTPYGKQVPWGTTRLGQEAIKHRARIADQSPDKKPGGLYNVAVIEYRDKDGTVKTKALESDGGDHSEVRLLDWLEDQGLDPAQSVVSLYTEREPCSHGGSPCTPLLEESGIPADRVTYSFEYGDTPQSRDQGNAELERRLKEMDDEAWKGLKEQAEREERRGSSARGP